MKYNEYRYGLFVHFVPTVTVDVDGQPVMDVKDLANRFDVERFANDVADMGVEYLIFTPWHWYVLPLFPSKVMEKWRPGKCADRDLIGEIIDAVRAKGIGVVLYSQPRNGYSFDETDKLNTGWGLGVGKEHLWMPQARLPGEDTFDYDTWNCFTRELYAELIDRYGDRLSGIFFDGFGPVDQDDFNVVDYIGLRSIIKSKAPDLPMIHNVFTTKHNFDYGTREIGPAYWYSFENPNGSQWPTYDMGVAIVFGEHWFATKKPDEDVLRFTPKDMFRYTVLQSSCAENGGVAWACGPYASGGWEKGVKEALVYVGKRLNALGGACKSAKPSTSYPTVAGTTLADLSWGVATTAIDGTKEYIHILVKPKGTKFTLPNPKDGAVFSNPVVVNSSDLKIVSFTQDDFGVSLEFSGTFDDLDTVISFDRAGGKPLGEEYLNNDSPRISYFGKWTQCISDAIAKGQTGISTLHFCYNHDIIFTTTPGSAAAFSFEGSRFEILGVAHETGAKAKVYVDGIPLAEINTASPAQVAKVLYSSPNLYCAWHQVQIVSEGDGCLALDAVHLIK